MAILPPGSIRVLIVEDDTQKLGMIVQAIKKLSKPHLVSVLDVRDAMSARRQLLQERFDLVMLDLRIPNRLGDLAAAEEGTNLLREIADRPRYQKPRHIIGITAYDDSFKQAESVFAEHLWALLKFDPTSDDWARQLLRKLQYLLDSKEPLRHPDSETYETDLAVIVALDDVELSAVTRLQGPWRELIVPNDSTRYLESVFSEGNKRMSVIAAAAPRMGMSMAAVMATKMIHNFRPRYLCMCGIAAGLKGKTNIGDILAPNPSWDWGSGKREVTKDSKKVFSPAAYQIPMAADIRDRLKAFVERNKVLEEIQEKWPGTRYSHSLRLHSGPVASGAAVLADVEVVDEVKEQQRHLLGIEMEIYGVLTAAENCGRPRPTAFALKSVCDFGDSDKSSEHQAYAAYTSAELLYRFALEELADEAT